MCRLEIRRTSAFAKSALADYGYHLAKGIFDAKLQAMIDRLDDKPFSEHGIPYLIESPMEEHWPRLKAAH